MTQAIGALDEDENLTPLGYHLAILPVDCRVGKLMLLGAIFGCLDPVLTIAASISLRSPFVAPFDKRAQADQAKLDFACEHSDPLTVVRAYNGWLTACHARVGRPYVVALALCCFVLLCCGTGGPYLHSASACMRVYVCRCVGWLRWMVALDSCVDGCMDGCVDGCVDVCVDGCVCACVHVRMCACVRVPPTGRTCAPSLTCLHLRARTHIHPQVLQQ